MASASTALVEPMVTGSSGATPPAQPPALFSLQIDKKTSSTPSNVLHDVNFVFTMRNVH
jgi:chitodextrinase